MELYGCGFNGFSQLLPQTSTRYVLSAVKILYGNKQSDLQLTTNATGDDVNNKIKKIVVSWSSLYIITSDNNIFVQGFCEENKYRRLGNFKDNIVDTDISNEKLYIITANKECNVLDFKTGLDFKVKGQDQAHFTNVSAGVKNVVAITDKFQAGTIVNDDQHHIFRPFDCAVQFTQVSCGNEHVLLLSRVRQVYSMGLGSRGQLGHGTTDGADEPRMVEALGGVAMVTVSAGGWHSVALSSIQDMYMWGWNETGQLGFRGSINSSNETSCSFCRLKEAAEEATFSDDADIGIKRTQLAHDGGNIDTSKKRKTSGYDTSQSSEVSAECVHGDNVTISVDDPDSKTRTATERVQEPTTNSSRENLVQRSMTTSSSANLHEENTVARVDEDSRDDVVLFQAIPSLLDLPGGVGVSKVSCGSRHTAAVSENGGVFTWGWNAYGQLGHGDRMSRDTPTEVNLFGRHQQASDIVCGAWNTLIIANLR